jgi:hypothetical protein
MLGSETRPKTNNAPANIKLVAFIGNLPKKLKILFKLV